MRRKDLEITDTKEIEAIIESGRVCRIALSYNDKPYVVPMNYGYQDSALYFHSAKVGKKVDMIAKNNNVCFEITADHGIMNTGIPCNWENRYACVIGYGKAFFIDDLEEKSKALNILVGHYAPDTVYDFSEGNLSSTAVIRIDIKEMTGKRTHIPEGTSGTEVEL
jgi:nitroimidazol reductase NimA-like FMN-containing flavoprotein (pyridoxamine 5'-phosphate oxidase superfamily)